MKLFEVLKNKPAVIAEIGINHNGDYKTAERLILEAKQSGADAVKFQAMNAEAFFSVYTASLLKDGHENSADTGVIDFFNKLSFTAAEWSNLKTFSDEIGIEIFTSVFDEESLLLMESIGVKLYKIASCDVTNTVLIKKVLDTGKPVVISCGMSDYEDIKRVVELLNHSKNDYCLLHCVSLYPPRDDEMNIAKISSMKNDFGCKVGFSDHSQNMNAVRGAVFLGAEIIEKHFKGSDNENCADSSVSLDKSDFANYVEEIRNCALLKGSGGYQLSQNEIKLAETAVRSLFAARDISEGEIITPKEIAFKRPGTGIKVYEVDKIIGKKTITKIPKDYLLRREYFE